MMKEMPDNYSSDNFPFYVEYVKDEIIDFMEGYDLLDDSIAETAEDSNAVLEAIFQEIRENVGPELDNIDIWMQEQWRNEVIDKEERIYEESIDDAIIAQKVIETYEDIK